MQVLPGATVVGLMPTLRRSLLSQPRVGSNPLTSSHLSGKVCNNKADLQFKASTMVTRTKDSRGRFMFHTTTIYVFLLMTKTDDVLVNYLLSNNDVINRTSHSIS